MSKDLILIVDDSKLERTVLCDILQSDYSVLEAENGQMAIEVLEENKERIGLILLDLVMPVVNGYTFLDTIKQNSELAVIPVIVLTQSNCEEDEVKALEHGANDFISKPYRPQIIKNRVANFMRLIKTAATANRLRFDPLTGLYTKEYFYKFVRKCLQENPDKEYTILCSNLENFKLYNDTFGREAGDALLIETSQILQKRTGDNSICGRYSADRFLCLLEKETERIAREHFLNARKINRSELRANLSVKLGVYEITDRTISVEQMCDRANLAVDSIKGYYNQYLAVYDDALRNRLLYEQSITDAMEKALTDNQFLIYFQPKYNLHSGNIMGAEALVRWKHPEYGLITPNDFIPLFERNGFICKLDEYVWKRTCEKLREWKDRGYSVVPISVNVSRADIYNNNNLADYFSSLTETYRIAPSEFHLEITESAYTENPKQIINTVEELRKRGFVIEMDDFGSGYSSLNMLSKISIDVLKLDMDFIRCELEKPLEQSILNDIINMAHRMHLSVVAEGIENSEQNARLKELGCDCVQGYFYAKPMTDVSFEELMKKSYREIKEQELEAGQRQREIPGAKRSILVVEDDEIERELLGEILSDEYIVITAKNGKEALELLNRPGLNISAVLLDIQMPVMNGYEFLEYLKRYSLFQEIPVIVTTMLSGEDEEEKCLKLGAADFIEKPYNAGKILMRINNLVHLKEYVTMISGLQTDALTGFKNRKVFYDDIVTIEKDSERSKNPLGIVFADVNGLKLVNDREGHRAGGQMLSEIAMAIREIFPEADKYRLGGDEFVIFSFDKTQKAFEDKLLALEKKWNQGLSAALGSIWLERAEQLEESVAKADHSMYSNKSRYYREKNHVNRNVQDCVSGEMLQKVDEVSEYLPGGFFIYKADEGEEIITFNSEILKLYECSTKEEFAELTGNSFRGMVHPEDLKCVEKAISEQIEKENDLDYVEYRIVCKNGKEKFVRDYGRFVHTELYGDVYYVFLNEIAANG